ncbi:MAG: hypothetical protein M0009_13340 [Deltaproteobacteria bacterium]|nr:hypothetical protein [Deltaproteobacteria bacterium]
MKTILIHGIVNLLTAILLLSAAPLAAQERPVAPAPHDAREVFTELMRPYRGLNDYTAQIRVKVDMPNLRVPEVIATIYFKKPDKFHVETRRFAPIPRNSGVFNPFQFDPEKNRIEWMRTEPLEGVAADLYRVEPLDAKSAIRYFQVWVGGSPKRILQVESLAFKGARGLMKFTQQWVEQSDGKWLLPAKVTVHLAFPEGAPAPEGSTPRDNPLTGGMRQIDELSGEGDIFISYSDWRVNRGLADSLFKP